MRYYIISGEASGDLHGSNLIKEIKKLDDEASIRAWGGDLMQDAGAELVKHYRDLAFMGFVEVLKNIRTIMKNFRFCKTDVLDFKPDVLILIDYPGFNLRMAEWAKLQGFKVVYYISPQVWAWKESRVKKIKLFVDKMLVILPFEKEFYEKWNYKVDYVGHPLVQVIDEYKKQSVQNKSHQYDKPVIALLPGSRKQEILMKLPVMLKVAEKFVDFSFVVAKAPGVDDSFYKSLLQPYKNVSSVAGKTYDLLSIAKAALVTSGTATLETALFGVPEIVCYKGSKISYQIAKRLIKVKFISLVNLIMDKMVVKELIQHDLTPSNFETELNKILFDQNHLQQLQNDYKDLKEKLSFHGNASANAASIIWNLLNDISVK